MRYSSTRYRTLIAFSVFLAVLMSAGLALAQNDARTRELQQEMEKTDEILERAREAVLATKSAQAKLAYDQAFQLQRSAWDRFRGQRYLLAADLTQKARRRALDALSAARNSLNNENVVLRRLEQAEQTLDLVHQQLADADAPQLREMLHSIRNNLDRAWEFYRAGEYLPALKVVTAIETAVRKLRSAVNLSTRSRSRYEHHVEMVRRQLEQVREVIADCQAPMAEPLFRQASQAFEMAERLAGEKKYEAALQNLQHARDLAGKAIQLCQGRPQLEQRYERLKEHADRIADRLTPDAPANLTWLLDQAREQLRLARQALDDNRPEAAAAALKAAQMSLQKLEGQLEQGAWQ